MIIVDLQELEDRARMATDSISGVVLEPEALLLIIHEIRRMKCELRKEHDHLTGMRDELLQLRTELVDKGRSLDSEPHAKQKKKAKTLTMRVVKEGNGNGVTKK